MSAMNRMGRVVFAHGLVIGKFYPPHLGHEYLVHTAARHCHQVTVGVLGSSGDSIPVQQRMHWLRDSFAHAPHVRIVAEIDDVPTDLASPAIWEAHVAIMRQAIAAADREYGAAPAVDAVFTSEDYGRELARRFAALSVCLDQTRALYPVSGTAVRANPVQHWALLPPAVRAGLALRIVVVGAESTGTTTLSRDLTQALRQRAGVWAQTAWVAEYGREYSANLLALARAARHDAGLADVVWHSEDFVEVAQEQCRREEVYARSGGPVLVCDTDAFATRLWHERYMGNSSADVDHIASAMPRRALYLLTCDEGVPFEDDGLRDGEHVRSWMNGRFRQLLQQQDVPWQELRGTPAQRCRTALEAVDACLRQAWRFRSPL